MEGRGPLAWSHGSPSSWLRCRAYRTRVRSARERERERESFIRNNLHNGVRTMMLCVVRVRDVVRPRGTKAKMNVTGSTENIHFFTQHIHPV